MSKEKIEKGMENVAGGVKSEPESESESGSENESREMGLQLVYGGPCIEVPKLPRVKYGGPRINFPKRPIEPLIPKQPVDPEK